MPEKSSSIYYGSNQTEFDRMAEQSFPAEFHMISGCHDSQTSADVSNLNSQFRSVCALCSAFCATFSDIDCHV